MAATPDHHGKLDCGAGVPFRDLIILTSMASRPRQCGFTTVPIYSFTNLPCRPTRAHHRPSSISIAVWPSGSGLGGKRWHRFAIAHPPAGKRSAADWVILSSTFTHS